MHQTFGVLLRKYDSPGILTDLWWRSPANSEAGWGVNVAQMGDVIFLSWFTYAADGKGMWIYGSSVNRTTGNTFSGQLFRNTGPAFNSVPWGNATATPVGNVTLAFTDSSNGTFTYTVDGVTQSKPITRDVYAPPATTCR